MEATVSWLDRLRQARSESLAEYLLPAITPGFDALDIASGLVATEVQGLLPPRPGDTSPVSMAILRYVDVTRNTINQQDQEELAVEISALMSLAADRRITVPKVLTLRVPGSPNISFLAYGSAVDRRLHGPVPDGFGDSIHHLLAQIGGLPEKLRPILGAAIRLHHAAIELFEIDLRAAYLLLVAGVEVLSREFGKPPGEWSNLDNSADWDATLSTLGLTDDQKSGIRDRLMKDRQLRLKATFREYAATRLPESFWDEQWENWMYTYNASTGGWEGGSVTDRKLTQDVLPRDRKLLSRLLGSSYDVRSGLVHRGSQLRFIDNALPISTGVGADGLLPFPVLRSLLRCLIAVEVAAHSNPVILPAMRLVRADKNGQTQSVRR